MVTGKCVNNGSATATKEREMGRPNHDEAGDSGTSDPSVSPKRKRGRPEKFFKIDDTPENVARALWGERSTKFPKKQGNQTLSGA